MASKFNDPKSQVSNGKKKTAAKQPNLSQTNDGNVNVPSIRTGLKQQLWQPNNLEPCQPITKTKFSKQSLTTNLTKSHKINKSNSTTQTSKNSKLPAMEKSKFTNRSISSATTNNRSTSATAKKFQNSNVNLNKPSTRFTQSARSNPSLQSSSSSPVWKSPFKTFVSTGTPRTRSQYGRQSQEFSYDLSPEELKFVNTLKSPMKPAPEQERQLLINGQRMEYLSQRYEHSPYYKYNYPEATSWRIGWLQQQQHTSGQGSKN